MDHEIKFLKYLESKGESNKEIKHHKIEQPLNGDCWDVQRGDRKWRDKMCFLKVG